MRRLATVAALAVVAAAGCGGDAEKRAATTESPESVVLGTDSVPPRTETTRTARAPRRKSASPRRAKPEPTPSPEPTPRVLTVIGDSLAVGTRELLPRALPQWKVRTDARDGRPLGEGVDVLAGADVPAGSVLAFSLFTNDQPGAFEALNTALRAAAARVGPRGCQVWATIVRPLPGGAEEPANDLLRGLDGRRVAGTHVVVADWAALIKREPALLAPDRVHGTPAGYRARAELYADAVNRCAR